MSACPAVAIPMAPEFPRTAAELYARIDADLTAKIVMAARSKRTKITEGNSAAFWERTSLRTAFRHLARYFERPLELIDLDEFTGITTVELEEKLDIEHKRAIWLLCQSNRMLKYAALYGWTSEAWRRREAWSPIRIALTDSEGGSVGCQGIVTWAIRNGWWPHTFSSRAMNDWILWKIKKHSISTVELEEWNFRWKLHEAGLQKLIPHFNLDSRSRARYGLSLKLMSRELREEILAIIRWKVHECDVDFRVRAVTGRVLRYALQAICGYATYELKICGLTSILQVITEDIIKRFISWMRHDPKRGCTWSSIHTTLSCIHALIGQKHPLFAGREKEYAWFDLIFRELPKDPSDELRARKLNKAVAYDQFAEIANKILAKIEDNPNLDPFTKACLYRDYLFCLSLSRHPWRQRNWRKCRTGDDNQPNIYCGEIPEDVLRDMALSPAEKEELKNDQAVWIAHFVESETKGGTEIWERIDPALIEPLKLYIEVHRPELVRRGPGSDTLLVSNSGRAMDQNEMSDLLVELSLRYIGRRLTPHIVRDIVVEHALANGCTFEQVQAMLWHVRAKSTQRYLSGFNASHAAVMLEREFMAMGIA